MKKLRTPWDMHDYQVQAVKHVLQHPSTMLWLDVGLGKTVISLSAIAHRLDYCQAFGTLVLAPKRVCRMVWRQEAALWEHTRHLTFSLVQGTPKERHYALRRPADVYLANYDNLPWLVDEIIAIWLARGEYPPFQALVLDEVTRVKDATGVWSKNLHRILPYFPFRIGLTGTPASNGYIDLFGQYLAVDGGYRLGTSVTDYREGFFYQEGYRHRLREGAEAEIKERVADITLSMTQQEYLPNLHQPLVNDIYIDLPPKARTQYNQLEKTMFFELDQGGGIEVFNAAALINKCLQAANGQPYVVPNTREWAAIHDEKLIALEEIVEESGHQPMLVAYEFQADLERILERFPQAVHLGGAMSEGQEAELQERWDRGDIEMMVGHPASMGHGLNLQYGGHIGVWFGLNWSLDLYLQFIGRLARQGQTQVPIFHRILARDTADEVQRDALRFKALEQDDLKATINAYRQRRAIS